LRVDGGPDTVAYKRLPVGHTHENIDAMFGTIWTNLRNQTIITFQEWKYLAKNAFDRESNFA
jgi:hypothetical protein